MHIKWKKNIYRNSKWKKRKSTMNACHNERSRQQINKVVNTVLNSVIVVDHFGHNNVEFHPEIKSAEGFRSCVRVYKSVPSELVSGNSAWSSGCGNSAWTSSWCILSFVFARTTGGRRRSTLATKHPKWSSSSISFGFCSGIVSAANNALSISPAITSEGRWVVLAVFRRLVGGAVDDDPCAQNGVAGCTRLSAPEVEMVVPHMTDGRSSSITAASDRASSTDGTTCRSAELDKDDAPALYSAHKHTLHHHHYSNN